MNSQLLDKINKWATCGALAFSSGKVIGMGVAAIGSGPLAYVPLTVGAVSLGAALAACTSTDLSDADGTPSSEGCQEVTGGVAALQTVNHYYDDTYGWQDFQDAIAVKIVRSYVEYVSNYATWGAFVDVIDANGTETSLGAYSTNNYRPEEWAKAQKWRLRPLDGATCIDQGGGNDIPGFPSPPPEIYDERQYVDNDTNCTYNVSFKGFAESFPGGPQTPVIQIESADEPETRAGGGRVGGCNFSPHYYYDNGNDPPYVVPVPSPDLGLDWKQVIANALAAAGGRLAYDAIKSAFTKEYNPTAFDLVAPCDKDDAGDALIRTWDFEKAKFEARCLDHQVAIMEILQQHLAWKTPTCNEKNEDPSGRYWRSITFESTAYSPNSNRRLTKRFRYRADSPGDVRQLATHWHDFVWDAGPVIVWHSGSALGSPKVWAASVDEGKRVIQHAGREAGVDPNQVGEWGVGGSDSSRYGVPGTMTLKQVDGCWSATARLGPNGWPEASYGRPDSKSPALTDGPKKANLE